METNVEQIADKIADLLLRAEMTDEERKGWLETLPNLNKEQIDDLIQTFENEL